jgi:glycosyltransferase involved in cell wall biosynthesis
MRVGFVYPHHGDGWLGGANYLRNLLTALHGAPDLGVRPVLLAGSRTRFVPGLPAVEVIRSRWLDIHTWFDVRGIWNTVESSPILEELLVANRVPLLSHSGFLGPRAKTRAIAWIPDLQHRHLSDLFSEAELAKRDHLFEATLRLSEAVIVSSGVARDDVERFFPGHTPKLRVLRFVDGSSLAARVPSREQLEVRHGFSGPYVLLPNQYWVHKNHGIVMEALSVLERRGRRVVVLSTGSPSDYRAQGHFEGLMRRRSELGLEGAYRTLGLVTYEDLAGLLRHAIAVVNPSLFEGWSTTVEEAKSLGKTVLLSDIPVHREQAPERAVYFDPRDPGLLADALWSVWTSWSRDEDAAAAERAAAALPVRRRAFAEAYATIALELAL